MRFDRYKWKPTTCKNLKEFYDLINDNGLIGKRVKKINIIGSNERDDSKKPMMQAARVLHDAGFSYEEIYKIKNRSYFDKVSLPCEVSICEPVVIVFDDDSTLEIKACRLEKDGFLVGINQIDKDIVDGLNPSTMDANILFKEIIGTEFENIRFDVASYLGEDISHTDKRFETTLKLLFGDFTLHFTNDNGDCWYKVGIGAGDICDSRYHYALKKTYKEINKAFKNKPYLEIVDGHDSGGYFLISSVSNKDPDILQRLIDNCADDSFCIEEVHIGYLMHFLDKYFDADYPYKGQRGNRMDDTLEFECYDVNCYTYETMNKMIDDVKYFINLLQNDYENPYLDKIKKSFYIGDFIDDYDMNLKYDKEKIYKNNIQIVIDFYERFIDKIGKMMEHNPNDDAICFCGP